MRRILILVILIAIEMRCSSPAPINSESEMVKKFETGLRGPVHFTNDSTWTIQSRMAHYGVPGVSIALIQDYKVAWVRNYGVTEKETGSPVTNNTLFQAGSISKPVAAYAALRLVDQGKFSLDENVNTYLRSWKLPDNEFTAEKKVALKHLLSHTGGVTVHGFLGYSPGLPVPSLVQVLDGAPPANSDPIRIDKVPETGFRYSGGGYCIMQQMVIDKEDKPFPEVMQELVLKPLNMTHSTYDQPLLGSDVKMAAAGYLPDGSMTKGKRHTYPEMAAAGLWTTAEDLAKFTIDVQKTLKGESNLVVSKAMAEKLTTPFVSTFKGLGMSVYNKDGEVFFGHGGWDEGFSCELVAHRDKGYGVVVLTNSNHPDFINEVINAVASTYQWAGAKSFTKVAMDTTRFATIRGVYFNGNDGTIRVFSEGSRLFMKYLRGNEPFELFQISDSTYLSRDGSHGVSPVQFKVNPSDGKLNYVFLGEAKGPIVFEHPIKQAGEKVPYEYLLEGDFDKALRQYQSLLKADPKDNAINQENINQQGYHLLEEGKNDLSKKLFRINTLLYPASANTYDSYADACLKNGDKAEAIENYKKALKLNPELKTTKKKLEDLLK